jgi:hypothetical protein
VPPPLISFGSPSQTARSAAVLMADRRRYRAKNRTAAAVSVWIFIRVAPLEQSMADRDPGHRRPSQRALRAPQSGMGGRSPRCGDCRPRCGVRTPDCGREVQDSGCAARTAAVAVWTARGILDCGDGSPEWRTPPSLASVPLGLHHSTLSSAQSSAYPSARFTSLSRAAASTPAREERRCFATT